MSPYEISLLLEFHVSPYAYETAVAAPILCETIRKFVALQLVEPCPVHGWKAGPALACYVEALCAIPAPVQTWSIPA